MNTSLQDTLAQKLRAKAFDLLGQREYSAHKLHQKLYQFLQTPRMKELWQNHVSPTEIKSILNTILLECSTKNFINDQRFATLKVRSLIRQKKFPQEMAHKIRQDIGLRENIPLDKILLEEDYNLDDTIEQFLIKRSKRTTDRQKLIRALAQRGISFEKAASALDQFNKKHLQKIPPIATTDLS